MRALPAEEAAVINRVVCSLLALFLAGGALAVDLTDEQRAAIEERIAPVGHSCLEGDSACAGSAAATASADEPRSGEAVYEEVCMACHASGVAGAPKYGDAASWADRIAKGKDALYASGETGVPGTGMMAKGGCMNCTDEEIRAAVDYMVAGSQ
jgi:cytochrome c5